MQNRVSSALPALPQAVQAQGVPSSKRSTVDPGDRGADAPGRPLRQPVSSPTMRPSICKDELARVAGRRQCHGVRRGPIRHADLARSREAAGTRARCRTTSSTPSSSRAAAPPGSSACRPPRPASPSSTPSTSPAGSTRSPSSRTSSSRPTPDGAHHAVARRRPRRARRADLQPDLQAQRPAGGRHRHLPASGGQRARCRRARWKRDGASCRRRSRRG